MCTHTFTKRATRWFSEVSGTMGRHSRQQCPIEMHALIVEQTLLVINPHPQRTNTFRCIFPYRKSFIKWSIMKRLVLPSLSLDKSQIPRLALSVTSTPNLIAFDCSSNIPEDSCILPIFSVKGIPERTLNRVKKWTLRRSFFSFLKDCSSN